MQKPSLIIISGRPGSGKSTLAHLLAREIRCPLISRDELKEGYVNTIKTEHSKIPNEKNVQIYNIFFGVIEMLLDNQVSLIAESAFQNKLWYPKYEILKHKSDIKLIICKIENDLANNRHAERKAIDPLREYYHGDAGRENSVYEPPQLPVPVLEVDTTDGYKPDLAEIKLFIAD